MKSEQVTVHLEPAMHTPITRMAQEWETSESAVVRRAIKHWLAADAPAPAGFNPDEWHESEGILSVPDGRPFVCTMRRYGTDGRRAHRIVQNRRSLWVLPDDRTTGKKRSGVIRDAIAACDGTRVDVLAYVAGCLLVAGAEQVYFQERN